MCRFAGFCSIKKPVIRKDEPFRSSQGLPCPMKPFKRDVPCVPLHSKDTHTTTQKKEGPGAGPESPRRLIRTFPVFPREIICRSTRFRSRPAGKKIMSFYVSIEELAMRCRAGAGRKGSSCPVICKVLVLNNMIFM